MEQAHALVRRSHVNRRWLPKFRHCRAGARFRHGATLHEEQQPMERQRAQPPTTSSSFASAQEIEAEISHRTRFLSHQSRLARSGAFPAARSKRLSSRCSEPRRWVWPISSCIPVRRPTATITPGLERIAGPSMPSTHDARIAASRCCWKPRPGRARASASDSSTSPRFWTASRNRNGSASVSTPAMFSQPATHWPPRRNTRKP